MTGTTAELGLATATDTDDIEVYNVSNLAAALVTLDALFSAAAGHDHSAAHKGKPIPAAGLAQPLTLTSPVLATPSMTSPSMTTATVSSGGLTITAGGLTITTGGLTLTQGPLTLGGADPQIIGGTNATHFRNHANSVDTLAISDGGLVSVPTNGAFTGPDTVAGSGCVRLKNNSQVSGSVSWKNNAANGDLSLFVDSSDQLNLGGQGTFHWATTSSATSGISSALPGAPQGYLTIVLNGSAQKLAYWNP